MQSEKAKPSGQRIMPETQLTAFPALSVYPRIGISLSASETGDRFYFSLPELSTDPVMNKVAVDRD